MDQVRQIYENEVRAARLFDLGKLEGAVAAPFQHVFGVELYPTIVQKAAKLWEGIARVHGYADGNKRLAWLTMVTFLQLNGLVLYEMSDVIAAKITDELTAGLMTEHQAVEWLNDRIVSLI